MVLSKKQTDAILLAVEEAGFANPRNDEDNLTDVQLAIYWIGEAEKGWKAGAKDEIIQTILNLSPEGVPVKEEGLDYFRGGIFELEDGLPIPKPIDEPAPHLPLDFTTLDDETLRMLHSTYNGYLARARFNHAMAVNITAAATHLKDDAYRKAYKEWAKKLEDEGTRPTKDLIDVYTREDEVFVMFERDARIEQQKVNSYKALVEIYAGNVDRLSREFTMRSTDYK